MSSPSQSSSSTKSSGSYFGIFDSKEQLIQQSTIAGQMKLSLKKLKLSKDQLAAILDGIKSVAQLGDITLLIIVGWVLTPLAQLWYEKLVYDPGLSVGESTSASTSSSTSTSTPPALEDDATNPLAPKPFHKTKIYHFFHTLSEMARLAMLVYLADLLKIFLLGAGFDIPQSNRLTHVFSYVVYTVWVFYRLSVLKAYLLKKLTKANKADPGRVQIINRFSDAGLFVMAIFALYEILNLQMGLALRGVVALGSVCTLVISLAMKDIAG